MLSQSCNENSLRTAQNSLRNGLPNAMITTYTYDPLIGITSMTDPKGYTVYYEYDDLHRLVRVKDEDGKIMSENKYHYLLDN
jgi:YD repeat-containing protein